MLSNLKTGDGTISEKLSFPTREALEQQLQENHAGYILITCDSPTSDGKMEVDMAYSGDEDLLSLLLHGAQDYFESHADESLEDQS